MDRFKFRVWDKRYSKYYYDVENSFEENIVLGIDYFGQRTYIHLKEKEE